MWGFLSPGPQLEFETTRDDQEWRNKAGPMIQVDLCGESRYCLAFILFYIILMMLNDKQMPDHLKSYHCL